MNNFMPFQSIGFIGLGLIGGSIAKHIRKVFPDTNILGYDVDTIALEVAKNDGTLSEITYQVDQAFGSCDVIFLCAPVHYNIEYLQTLKNILKPDCILTDVGSVKGDIYQAVKDIMLSDHFIGGHPMIGSEKCGYQAARETLMENAYYFVTPSPTVNQDKVAHFSEFIRSLGALPIVYSPEEHDKVTSYISHIPHVIAASLVNLVKEADNDGLYKELAAGGFKDITRIASSSPTVWEHILLSNPDNVRKGLDEYISLLTDISKAIEKGDGTAINAFFASAMTYRNSVPNKATGVIETHYECFIDIPDKPGALSEVTRLLSQHQINIKNIGIANNREEREGALCLELYYAQDLENAVALLQTEGYPVFRK